MNRSLKTIGLLAFAVSLIAFNASAEPGEKIQDPVRAFATRENCQTFFGQDSAEREGVSPQYAVKLAKAIEALNGPNTIRKNSLEKIGVVCRKLNHV